MKEMNGIHVFDDGELPALPDGLSRESSLKSDFGFKIVRGINGLEWQTATEDDMRISESARLGILPDQVKMLGGCDQIGPTQCSTEGGFCWASTCRLMFNPTPSITTASVPNLALPGGPARAAAARLPCGVCMCPKAEVDCSGYSSGRSDRTSFVRST